MVFEIFGGELPEGIQQMLAQQIDRGQMAHAASYHSMFTLFDELNTEQTKTLGALLHACAGDNPGIANYLEGIAAAYMRLKHDTCMGCGSSHTPNFEEAQDQADTTESKPTDEEYQSRLKEYNLNLGDDGLITCGGCGQRYASLADRMLKKPDDCDGCHQKAKWG